MGAVNFSIDLQLVQHLKQALPLSIFVETGAFEGESVQQARPFFDKLYTVELADKYFQITAARFKGDPAVEVCHGHSVEFLERLCPILRDQSVLYWLDAHWCAVNGTLNQVPQCPLLQELEAIHTLNSQSVILIDDARLFLSPPAKPHQVKDWPDFEAVIKKLGRLSSAHKLMVVNDVIIYFPDTIEEVLQQYADQYSVDWLATLNQLRAKEELIQTQQAELAVREELIHEQQSHLVLKEKVIQEQQFRLIAKDELIQAQRSDLLAREETIQTLRYQLLSQEETFRGQQAELAAQKAVIQTQQAELMAQEAVVQTQQAELMAQEVVVQTQQADLMAQEAVVQTQQADLMAQEAVVQTQQADLMAQEAVVQTQQADLMAQEAVIQTQQAELMAQEAVIQMQQTELVAKEAVIQEQYGHLVAKEAVIQRLKWQAIGYWLAQPIKRWLNPRLGVLYHYPPIPLKIPSWYTAQTVPNLAPVISIITPSFNHAGFLERTIKSVLDQAYPALEYLIQDGGSTDDTSTILESYRSRLARCVSATDKGQACALNLGFAQSSGEIMAYLNSDDLLLPGTLNYVADFFVKHPDVDVVYSHRVLIDENDGEIGRWVLPPHNNRVLYWADYIPQETLFWRRRIWEQVGGYIDESFRFALDWELILRFQAAGAKFVRLPRFLGAFRVHAAQKSSTLINNLGQQEMARLRKQYHGREVSWEEIGRGIGPYLARSVVYHKLYRLGALRY